MVIVGSGGGRVALHLFRDPWTVPRCSHIDYGTTGASVLPDPELEAGPHSGGVPRRHTGVKVRPPRVQTPLCSLLCCGGGEETYPRHPPASGSPSAEQR